MSMAVVTSAMLCGCVVIGAFGVLSLLQGSLPRAAIPFVIPASLGYWAWNSLDRQDPFPKMLGAAWVGGLPLGYLAFLASNWLQ